MVCLEVSGDGAWGVAVDDGVGVGGVVVDDGGEGDVPCACGLEGEDGVVDAAELSGGDEDEWPALLCGVVGGEGEFGVERDGQSAGALDEDEFVSAGEFVGAAGDEGEVESSVLGSSGEAGGGGAASSSCSSGWQSTWGGKGRSRTAAVCSG